MVGNEDYELDLSLCWRCRGTGRVKGKPCPKCGGTGDALGGRRG